MSENATIMKCKKCGREVVYLPVQLPEEDKIREVLTDWDSLPPQDQRNFLENIRVMFDGRRGHMPHSFTCKLISGGKNEKNNQ